MVIILSDQLLIVALVSRNLTNKLIRTRADPRQSSLSQKGVSGISSSFLSYSEPKGTFPRVTHPSAADPKGPLDLHVLSLPPAFALSQDQISS